LVRREAGLLVHALGAVLGVALLVSSDGAKATPLSNAVGARPAGRLAAGVDLLDCYVAKCL